jgi:hypothetical protein
MAFVRIKKIKGKEYAYLVQSKWRSAKGKTPKQKFKAYLGRVYKLAKEKDIGFWETVDSDAESYLRLATKEKMLHDLVRYELIKHGFNNADGIWTKDFMKIDIKKRKILNDNRAECVLSINEGHLCSHKIKELLKFEQTLGVEESGYKLAKMFIESGINVPQDVFIAYYEKT